MQPEVLLQKIDFAMYLINQGENRQAAIELLALKETLIEEEYLEDEANAVLANIVNIDRMEG